MKAAAEVRRATGVLPAGQWHSETAVGSVTLAYDERHRRRLRMTDDAGESFLLDLPDTVVLAEGDGLVLTDSKVIQVRAAIEAVADVSAPEPADRLRLAWHMGNRHAPIEVLSDGTFRIRDDHVLIDMLTRLGASVIRRIAPFAPERGAYHGTDPQPHPHHVVHRDRSQS